ncbi:hypothetical protein AXF42_Ash016704 [Apostasia shenzhenica]|uniref:Uncharacterized protein n=1 Tax=Apostasia shenzhenica TaxID=1088818 RepID=A0A2I0AQ43_9ASPA|nr:hypothetical protein AXF42_Ash016704 [Apostasia shenzhenica]
MTNQSPPNEFYDTRSISSSPMNSLSAALDLPQAGEFLDEDGTRLGLEIEGRRRGRGNSEAEAIGL